MGERVKFYFPRIYLSLVGITHENGGRDTWVNLQVIFRQNYEFAERPSATVIKNAFDDIQTTATARTDERTDGRADPSVGRLTFQSRCV